MATAQFKIIYPSRPRGESNQPRQPGFFRTTWQRLQLSQNVSRFSSMIRWRRFNHYQKLLSTQSLPTYKLTSAVQKMNLWISRQKQMLLEVVHTNISFRMRDSIDIRPLCKTVFCDTQMSRSEGGCAKLEIELDTFHVYITIISSVKLMMQWVKDTTHLKQNYVSLKAYR